MVSTHPVRDVFVEANGLRHHLLVRGAPGTPAVMMLHGLAQQAHVFDAVANRLASRYHVYCLDVRGRGESAWGPADGYHIDNYVDDLEAVREALAVPRFALVGTSMGGQIAYHYAARHPERVSRLVLNDIGPAIDPAGLRRIVEYVSAAPDAFPDMRAVVKYYREHYGPMIEALPEDQLSEFARWNVRHSDVDVYVWKMDPSIRTFQAPAPSIAPWDAYRAVSCPVLILRGEKSDVLSHEIAEQMQAAPAGTVLVEVPGAGHAPLLTEPVAVKALDEFLGES